MPPADKSEERDSSTEEEARNGKRTNVTVDSTVVYIRMVTQHALLGGSGILLVAQAEP